MLIYIFLCWFLESSFQVELNFDNDKDMPKRNKG